MLSRLSNRIAGRTRRIGQRWMSFEAFQNYKAVNEPVLQFLPGSPERENLLSVLKRYEGKCVEVPIIIGDEEIRTSDVKYQVAPFDHQRQVAKFYYASPEIVQKAIDTAVTAQQDWELMPVEERAAIFLKAADLSATKYRYDLLATSMLGQGKNMYQAEIDAAAELIDFYRFNVMFGAELTKYQPISTTDSKNSFRLRALEGFWAAVAPFNFTAIGANLATAPCVMGNVSLWKPSDGAVLSNYVAYKILREAGLPPGVINFVPADGPVFGNTITASPHLAGLNFTGSVQTFSHLWKQVGLNIEKYFMFPRLIGECGGKNFHLAHPSADMFSVVNATIKSAFEFSGQKCSACSRLYVPKSAWPEVKEGLLESQSQLKLGSPLEVDNYLSAVIDNKAFSRIKSYVKHAQKSPNLKILAGGGCDDSVGYFIEPTIIETQDPHDKIMKEEIFGPVVTVYAYKDDEFDDVVELADSTSPFGLTGSLFAQDRDVIVKTCERLRHSSGNFYINDQSTGSVVGQQPFGGGRKSGTNDKAGGPHYMLKFASPLATKETIVPINRFDYDYMRH